MTKEPACCGPDTNLAAAAELMWKTDCGVLPVVDNGNLAGMITDRDICIALGTRNQRAGEIAVKDVAAREVQTCSADEDIARAMLTMRRAKVRRLPGVSNGGKLEGIVALNDLALATERKREIDQQEVLETMRAVSQHRGQKEPEKLKFPAIPVAVA